MSTQKAPLELLLDNTDLAALVYPNPSFSELRNLRAASTSCKNAAELLTSSVVFRGHQPRQQAVLLGKLQSLVQLELDYTNWSDRSIEQLLAEPSVRDTVNAVSFGCYRHTDGDKPLTEAGTKQR